MKMLPLFQLNIREEEMTRLSGRVKQLQGELRSLEARLEISQEKVCSQ